jgi:hypothetical protein
MAVKLPYARVPWSFKYAKSEILFTFSPFIYTKENVIFIFSRAPAKLGWGTT